MDICLICLGRSPPPFPSGPFTYGGPCANRFWVIRLTGNSSACPLAQKCALISNNLKPCYKNEINHTNMKANVRLVHWHNQHRDYVCINVMALNKHVYLFAQCFDAVCLLRVPVKMKLIAVRQECAVCWFWGRLFLSIGWFHVGFICACAITIRTGSRCTFSGAQFMYSTIMIVQSRERP